MLIQQYANSINADYKLCNNITNRTDFMLPTYDQINFGKYILCGKNFVKNMMKFYTLILM